MNENARLRFYELLLKNTKRLRQIRDENECIHCVMHVNTYQPTLTLTSRMKNISKMYLGYYLLLELEIGD